MKHVLEIPYEKLEEFNHRRPFDDDNPDGYLESDKDFIRNNEELCVWFLEQLDNNNTIHV